MSTCRSKLALASVCGLAFASFAAGGAWEYLQQGPYVLQAKAGTFADGKVWGTELELTEDGREIRLPFSKLRYFSHWGNVPAFKPGWKPDCRQFKNLRFCYGAWLCPKATDKAHGLEVSSVKVVQ